MIVAAALDLGTTSIKAGLLTQEGVLHGIVVRPAPVIVGKGGRYASDAATYATTAESVLAECLVHAPGRPPLGMCSQRSSFLIWDRASGQPVTPLISWQDNRGAESCVALRTHEPLIRRLSGLPLSPYYLAPKLRATLREQPAWRERLMRGEWLLGTLDTFLIWRWTGGEQHMTDASMAARTLLMDVRSGQWSPALCDLFDVPHQILPDIHASVGMGVQLQNGLRLEASLGDQSAALVGSIAGGEAEALVNLGTGGFVIRYLPEGRSVPPGYLETLVWQDQEAVVRRAAEGTLNSIAAALAPYPADACCPEALGSDDIFCLAEPSGLGAPYFRNDLGITFSASPANLSAERVARLLQEGIIFRVADMLEDFQREFGVERAYLSGGLSALSCLQQGIAQCAPCPTYRLLQADAGLCGAGCLASGSACNVRSYAEKIEVQRPAPGLRAKYDGWKAWLDGLLRRGPSVESRGVR